ncbi:DUF29 domain-containing protein [Pannus brasiliensis CCIBt3594]|uniref:DUF29 domain-containing protein n=1 Tax=Pannus brasiliensis CCIBt3594 TaxID=1427578 RepID=A0AAW9QQU3_9CHRO
MTARLSLYDRDFPLWIEATVRQLRERDFDSVDWENVIEEIDSLGRDNKSELKRLVTQLLVYLLKLAYLPTENQRESNEWKAESLSVRFEIENILEDSPSLKPYLLENFDSRYETARKIVSDLIGRNLPTEKIVSPEEAFNEDWFPKI